jgi:hypothetical protein
MRAGVFTVDWVKAPYYTVASIPSPSRRSAGTSRPGRSQCVHHLVNTGEFIDADYEPRSSRGYGIIVG